MVLDPLIEAKEIAAGSQAAFDWLQEELKDAPFLLKEYAQKYLNMGSLGPLVTKIVKAVDIIRDEPTQMELPLHD